MRLSCDGCPFRVKARTTREVCEVCGEPIFADTEHFARGERLVCADCAQYLTLDELLPLFGLRDAEELLEAFGYLRVI